VASVCRVHLQDAHGERRLVRPSAQGAQLSDLLAAALQREAQRVVQRLVVGQRDLGAVAVRPQARLEVPLAHRPTSFLGARGGRPYGSDITVASHGGGRGS
jgi:hypothetical protein